MNDVPVTSRRRRSQQRTQFETSRQTQVLRGLAVGAALIALIVGVFILSGRFPDFGLTLQGGGFSHANDTAPRNFRLWAVQPGGAMRFATAFFPVRGDAPASEVFSAAGPLVNKPEDMLQTTYFGALNLTAQFQNSEGNDASRQYLLYYIEHDPQAVAYGVNTLSKNSPYISPDPESKGEGVQLIAMGAPQQTYYAQVIVAIAFPPGTDIRDVAHTLKPTTKDGPVDYMLRPYRRVTIKGWTVYYFDQTSLPQKFVIRIQYVPTKTAGAVPEMDFWQADRMR